MHVMKVIWLILAACPCLSIGRAYVNRENIAEEILEEMLSEDVGNPEMFSSKQRSTEEMDIIKSFLRGRITRNDILDSSHIGYRYPQHRSKRTRQTNRTACCPSYADQYSPLGGVSRSGRLIYLYRDNDTVQSFYQSRCLSNIVNKPCRFIDSRYRQRSKCVQLYTYKYALIRYNRTSSTLHGLDFMVVKAGCSCRVLV